MKSAIMNDLFIHLWTHSFQLDAISNLKHIKVLFSVATPQCFFPQFWKFSLIKTGDLWSLNEQRNINTVVNAVKMNQLGRLNKYLMQEAFVGCQQGNLPRK